jgi:hypothetical protein
MSPCTVAFGFCINRQLIPAERFFPSDLFVDILVLMVDCRLSRFDLSAAETEPIIDEFKFVRLLEAKGHRDAEAPLRRSGFLLLRFRA